MSYSLCDFINKRLHTIPVPHKRAGNSAGRNPIPRQLDTGYLPQNNQRGGDKADDPLRGTDNR